MSMNSTNSTKTDSDTLIFIAIIKHKAFFDKLGIEFSSNSCFDAYKSRVSDKKLNILKSVCGLDVKLSKKDKAELDKILSLI